MRKFLISGREKFGVQQLPPFNLLKPEELDRHVLPFVTRRWKMIGHESAQKFALGDAMIGGMGLKMPFGGVIESCWIWACRCHPRMFECQNGVHVWNAPKLYLGDDFD